MATMYRALRTAAAGALFLLAAFVVLPATAQTPDEALFYEALAAVNRGDYATAWRGFHRLANRGHPTSQLNLGIMYHNGNGVPQNYVEAMKWWRRAAKQGNAMAQTGIGYMYANGEGVPQDYVEAAQWYRLAAEQGFATAQNNLGVLYEYGQGVPQDYALAHMWYNLAVAGTPAGQTDERNQLERNRDDVARLLSRNALARAQRMAREWRPGVGSEGVE